MSKIIKVSTDLEVTVHDYPEGMLETQNRQLCELIGDGCDMIENVMPKRLYRELGHTTTVCLHRFTGEYPNKQKCF